MRRLILYPALALIALAAGAPAQETAPAQDPLLLCCSDWIIVQELARKLEQEVELPTLEEGQCYEARVNADGSLAVAVTDTCSDYLKLSANPAALMELFEVETKQAKSMAVMVGSMSLARQGMKMEEIISMVETLFSFPKQVASIDLRLAEFPEPGTPIDAELSLSAVAGSWFAQVVDAAQPNKGGMRMLPDADAQMVGAINIDFAKLLPHLRGLLTQIQTLTIQGQDSRESAAAVLDGFYGSMLGTYSFTFDAEHGMRWLAGLSDPVAAKTAMQDPMFAAMLEDAAGDMADVSVDAKAFTHRDVEILEQVSESDSMAGGMGSALAPDGTRTSTFAVAGDSMVGSSLAGSAAEIKAIIDQVLDQKIGKRDIPGGALITIDMKVLAIAESIAMLSGMPLDPNDREQMPADLNASLSKTGDSLVLRIKSD